MGNKKYTAEFKLDSVRLALSRKISQAQVARDLGINGLFHSDRGSQYVSDDVEAKLKMVNISMSRKGNCWDNAVAESFFGTLKREHVNR